MKLDSPMILGSCVSHNGRQTTGGKTTNVGTRCQKSESSRSGRMCSFHKGTHPRGGAHVGNAGALASRHVSINWPHECSIQIWWLQSSQRGSLYTEKLGSICMLSIRWSIHFLYSFISSSVTLYQAILLFKEPWFSAVLREITVVLIRTEISLWSLGFRGFV